MSTRVGSTSTIRARDGEEVQRKSVGRRPQRGRAKRRSGTARTGGEATAHSASTRVGEAARRERVGRLEGVARASRPVRAVREWVLGSGVFLGPVQAKGQDKMGGMENIRRRAVLIESYSYTLHPAFYASGAQSSEMVSHF